jgi:cytochrome c5
MNRTLPLILGVTLLFIGCSRSTEPAPEPSHPNLMSNSTTAPAAAPKGRAELWSQTCNRCHNTRPPDSYNANEWATVMLHMRIRGYLPGSDQRAIQEFLQSQ